MMKFLMMLFALLREFKSVTITIKNNRPVGTSAVIP